MKRYHALLKEDKSSTAPEEAVVHILMKQLCNILSCHNTEPEEISADWSYLCTVFTLDWWEYCQASEDAESKTQSVSKCIFFCPSVAVLTGVCVAFTAKLPLYMWNALCLWRL